jgi:hypothetical protein
MKHRLEGIVMDIHTLSAVVAKMQSQSDYCKDMLKWAASQQDETDRIEMSNLWAICLTQANEAVAMVQNMLDAELDQRAQEAA